MPLMEAKGWRLVSTRFSTLPPFPFFKATKAALSVSGCLRKVPVGEKEPYIRALEWSGCLWDLGLILPMVELTGLLRVTCSLFTDGPCYSLVVLLVGKSKDIHL